MIAIDLMQDTNLSVIPADLATETSQDELTSNILVFDSEICAELVSGVYCKTRSWDIVPSDVSPDEEFVSWEGDGEVAFSVAAIIEDNLLNREEEPEDSILVSSDFLLRLLEQARQEPPTFDWERHLDEL